MEAPEPGARGDSAAAIPESVVTPETAPALDAPTIIEGEEEEALPELEPAADAESLLPHHAGSPRPGEATLAVGVENLVVAGEVRLALADWVRLDVQAQFDTLAPLIGTEVRFAAGGPRAGLWAHVFVGGALRPVFDANVMSGARAQTGLGLVYQDGPWVVGLGGGLLVGFSFNPIDDRSRLSDQVDQTGGIYSLQRLEVAFDVIERLQLILLTTLALPLDTVNLDEGSTGVLPSTEFRLGGRVALRF